MALRTAAEVRPATADALAQALCAANDAGQAVAPRGGGTQLDLGTPPSRLDLVLHTTGLNRVVEYEPADLTVTVEAGLLVCDLQALLAEQGQFLALDPALESAATIGGVLATNVSGPLRFAFGTARDLVIGTRVANPDGTLTRAGGRVVKNVAGYDLNKLYIGSLGTLGVIVQVSFKLAPIPPATSTLVGQFGAFDALRSVVAKIVHSPLSPLAIEVLGRGAAAAAGLPAAPLLVLRLGGYPAAVERQVRDLGELISANGGTRPDTANTAWTDVAAMRLAAARRPVLLKAAAPIAQSIALVEVFERELAGLEPVVWAHAGNGVAFAGCAAPEDASLLGRLRQSVTALGDNASLVAHRTPTRDFDAWGDPGSSLALMRAIKAKLDPRNTLNPGRYVGGI
jgi:glycolate dehydrogenase FAD-binding subunit